MKKRYTFLLLILFIYFPKAYGQNADVYLYDRWHQQRNTAWDPPMRFFSKTTYPVSLALPLGHFIYGLAKQDENALENGIESITALAITSISTYGIKQMVDRKRPYIRHPGYIPDEWEDTPSFPSGHTSIVFTTAGNLSFQYKKWYIVVPAFTWAGIVAYSRIHLGAHYPGDVLGGAVLGITSAYLTHRARKWLQGKKPEIRGSKLFLK